MVRPVLSTNALRWALLPAFVVLVILVGLAVGTESRAEFEQGRADDSSTDSDTNDEAGPAESAQQPSDQSGSTGSATEQGGGSPAPGGPASSEGSTATDGPDVSFEVRGGEGRVGVRLDPDGSDVAFPVSGDGESGLPTELVPERIPEGSGLRLEPDGELRASPLDETGRGDVVLIPVEDGIDLQLPGGDRVEIRQNGPNGSDLDLNRIAADGTATELEPGDDGSVDVGEGVDVQLPTGNGGIPEADDPLQIRWRWFLIWLISTLLSSLALAFYLHRNGPPLFESVDFTPPEEVNVTRFMDFLTILRCDTDPSRAIRLAFEGAERGLGSLPARADTETPFEWHARVAARQPHLDETLLALCSRFTTARFAPERPTTAERDAAVDDLHQLAVLAGYDEVTGQDPAPETVTTAAS